ncbi:MAG: hypothetical protein VYE67_13225, partial [Planctomycetota bacterium]|nr:hypothetical protein [Planctomycetota bacterium]
VLDRCVLDRCVLDRCVLDRRVSARIFRKVGTAKPHRRNKDLKWKKSCSHDLRVKVMRAFNPLAAI